jgi:hypothetical protein
MIWIGPSEKDTDNAALEKRLWDAADLYETPLSDFGKNYVERLFNNDEIANLISFVEQLAA